MAETETRDGIARVIRIELRKQTGDNCLDNATLESLGLDSLDCIELAMDLEKEFDRDLPDEFCPVPSDTVADVIGKTARHWNFR